MPSTTAWLSKINPKFPPLSIWIPFPSLHSVHILFLSDLSEHLWLQKPLQFLTVISQIVKSHLLIFPRPGNLFLSFVHGVLQASSSCPGCSLATGNSGGGAQQSLPFGRWTSTQLDQRNWKMWTGNQHSSAPLLLYLVGIDGQSWGRSRCDGTDVQGSERTPPLEQPVSVCRRSLETKIKAKCLLHS